MQFDAHLDIHNFADCTPELSHGNFLLHCAGPLPPLVNVGHRELLLPPDYVARHYRLALPAEALALDPRAGAGRAARGEPARPSGCSSTSIATCSTPPSSPPWRSRCRSA